MKLLVISQDHPKIALAEIAQLTNSEVEFDSPLAFVDSDMDFSRLAYAKEVCKLLFSADSYDEIANFDWSQVKGTFAVRADKNERKIASLIHPHLTASVDLESPDFIIRVFHGKEIYFALHEKLIHSDFEARRPHKKPEMRPIGMHPRLACACVNLTGVHKGTICDPFCGAGGILVEAGILGLDIVGSDISSELVEMAKTNLAHYKLPANVSVADATTVKLNCDAIVADLPYGKNTKNVDVLELLKEFLKNAEKNNIKNLVIMLPSTCNPDLGSWTVLYEFTYYLHKSLSKKILVLTK